MSKSNPRAKAAAVSFDDLDVARARDPRVTSRPSIGTAPGQAMQNAALRAELDQWNGARPVRRLDPTTISRGKWANRIEESFQTEEFFSLKKEIELAGGNIQPIKVRPVKNKPGFFEIVFGHRRHQACLELGLPVLAMIDELTDAEAFVDMDRENRVRQNLSAYEQGLAYARALKEGLFPSQNKLADALGIQRGNLSAALRLGLLPLDVVKAFPRPHDLQFRWAAELADAVEQRQEEVVEIARKIQLESPRPSAREVFDRLVRPPAEADKHAAPFTVKLDGTQGQSAKILVSPGSMSMTINLKKVDARRATELERLIQDFLK